MNCAAYGPTDASCMMMSMGYNGAMSCGPIGCPVPGLITGGSGVAKSACTLYHAVGISLSSSRYFT